MPSPSSPPAPLHRILGTYRQRSGMASYFSCKPPLMDLGAGLRRLPSYIIFVAELPELETTI